MNPQIDPGEPERGIVVAGDDPAVGRQSKIGLDRIGPLAPSQFDRGKRILRRVPRGPAMGDDLDPLGSFEHGNGP